jgi:hypothetical protein
MSRPPEWPITTRDKATPSDAMMSTINTTFGADLHRPTGVESPRQFRLSAQFDF